MGAVHAYCKAPDHRHRGRPIIADVGESRFPSKLVKSLMAEFMSVVGAVVAFYFGSGAVITGPKRWTTAQNPEAARMIGIADRDFLTVTRDVEKE